MPKNTELLRHLYLLEYKGETRDTTKARMRDQEGKRSESKQYAESHNKQGATPNCLETSTPDVCDHDTSERGGSCSLASIAERPSGPLS